MLVIAHLSDTHLDGGERAASRTRRVMDYLAGLPRPVDAVLVTGDVADHGLPAEYEEARKLLVSPLPVLSCPGNHDARGPFREVFLGGDASPGRPESGGAAARRAGGTADGDGSEGPINRVHRVGGAVFAMCDSSIPGRDDGRLDDATLDWLEGVLRDAADGEPVIVCFHHPPVLLHSPFIDGIRQRGEERLAALADRYPSLVAFLCGHAHTPAAATFAGRPLRVAPGVVSTLMLPWELGEDGDVLDRRLPPALAFHVLDDDHQLITHYRVVP